MTRDTLATLSFAAIVIGGVGYWIGKGIVAW